VRGLGSEISWKSSVLDFRIILRWILDKRVLQVGDGWNRPRMVEKCQVLALVVLNFWLFLLDILRGRHLDIIYGMYYLYQAWPGRDADHSPHLMPR
jgi:hypothetical protein